MKVVISYIIKEEVEIPPEADTEIIQIIVEDVANYTKQRLQQLGFDVYFGKVERNS